MSSPFKQLWTVTDKVFDAGFTFLIILGGSIIALSVVLQVLLRYVFKLPLFGLEEFSRLIAIWVYFLGAIFGTKMDSHVQGDIAGRLFPGVRAGAIVKVLVWILSLAACVLFFYHSWKYNVWLYGTGERTTGLWWPRITSVGSMAFGGFFMTIYCIANIIKYFTIAMSGKTEGVDAAESAEAEPAVQTGAAETDQAVERRSS